MRILQDSYKGREYALEFDYHPYIIDFIHNVLQRDEKTDIVWNSEKKRWYFNRPDFITKICKHFGKEVEVSPLIHSAVVQQIEDISIQKQRLEQAEKVKQQKVSTINIKGLKQPLYEYQKVGVEFLTAAGGRGILADAPGVGKSAQALSFLVHNKIERTLVICPASVKYAWESETEKWTHYKAKIIDTNLIKKSFTHFIKMSEDYQVFIINYDLLKKYFQLLMTMRFDCMIVDEFHAIKNNSAIRTKIVKSLSYRIPKVVLLSGTPMLNRPVELFNGLHIVDPKKWSSWRSYTNRYCGLKRTPWGWDVSGASNIEELRDKINPYFLRRTKDEVLTELPPKNFIDVPIHLSSEFEKIYNKAEKSLAEFLRDIKDKTDEEIKRSMAAEKLVKLNELRQLTTKAKIDTACELIDQLIENQEKVIVFSIYNEAIDTLRNKYGDQAVGIDGRTPVSERGAIIKDFQTNPARKIFVGGTKAAGVGITLTAASNVIFIDYSWVPAEMEQAADRAHRIGQEAESVNIYQIFAQKTIDHYMVDILKDKQNLINQLIDGKAVVDQKSSVVETIFKNIENKHNT